MKIGILPLGRPTFDVTFAQHKLAEMLLALDKSGHDIVGPTSLLLDSNAVETAMGNLQSKGIDRLLVLQVTFTDANTSQKAGLNFNVPLSIWAVPEPRLGRRLRLNAFCGLNLASHALGLIGVSFSWLYADPEKVASGDLDNLLSGEQEIERLVGLPSDNYRSEEGTAVANTVNGKRIGRIGQHPDGFHTCAYSADELTRLSGVSVDEIELGDLFETAKAVSDAAAFSVMEHACSQVSGLGEVNADELDKSLRLKAALDKIGKDRSCDAFAIRCWPETFTEYGGAVCGPVSMLGEQKIPCACEADVYGSLTQLILQEATQAPVFLTDLVDIDVADNTAVVWHCGQAPISMRQPDVEAEATIHTNRKMPLLYEFPLKHGRVTLMRISQAFGETKMLIAGGTMLCRPMAFTGTSGVFRFDRDVRLVLDDIMASGVEHHMALAYGEHRPLLRSVASAMKLPVLEL